MMSSLALPDDGSDELLLLFFAGAAGPTGRPRFLAGALPLPAYPVVGVAEPGGSWSPARLA